MPSATKLASEQVRPGRAGIGQPAQPLQNIDRVTNPVLAGPPARLERLAVSSPPRHHSVEAALEPPRSPGNHRMGEQDRTQFGIKYGSCGVIQG